MFTRHAADGFPGFTRPSFSACSHPVPLPRRCHCPSLVRTRLLVWGQSGRSTATIINAQPQQPDPQTSTYLVQEYQEHHIVAEARQAMKEGHLDAETTTEASE